MGHKRYNYLPKTKKWIDLVKELDGFASGNSNIESIAKQTLQNVRNQFEKLEDDPSIYSSFEYLLELSNAFQKENPLEYLKAEGIFNEKELSVLKLGRGLKKYKEEEAVSKEYQTLANQAGIEALNKWYKDNIDIGYPLFSEGVDNEAVFLKISDARKFSDLTRYYFASFTERYLKYFLERSASGTITNINEREKFNKAIDKHIQDISKHALETTNITQGFIAGWHNKYAKGLKPNKREIRKFLSYSLKKMKGELLREETA
jgi:hypothetical protein